jgi:hypothetical protein
MEFNAGLFKKRENAMLVFQQPDDFLFKRGPEPELNE